jgi:hypothetical protein
MTGLTVMGWAGLANQVILTHKGRSIVISTSSCSVRIGVKRKILILSGEYHDLTINLILCYS